MGASIKEYSHTYFLTPGECNPQQQLPMPLLVSRLIEVATEHANAWGVGYAKLKEDNEAWVLSRVTVDMKRYPHVNEHYTFVTWIEDYNRHFSQRNFVILDENGKEIGFSRTIWVVINVSSREICDISKLSYICDNISKRECPTEKQSRLTAVKGGTTERYTFRYTDTDFNRHVNSVRYIEHFMNHWSFEHYDKYMLKRFEISYMKECLYGMEVNINFEDNMLDCHAEIESEGTGYCRARFVFAGQEK